ncbi:uncharacterized protein PV09_06957 [Verruconis gallopava]|uniref:Uncharacterized protein n=1 Tax=Verruconis gallopava TaxID=253628 RepID=A0A0D2A5G5_9PEZI|nr:uncharacterized protein PV09_06957 [Verruconis gallopava]KIW01785.1 hypothetical protein PV09_06957 [Verruconis gallopava]
MAQNDHDLEKNLADLDPIGIATNNPAPQEPIASPALSRVSSSMSDDYENNTGKKNDAEKHSETIEPIARPTLSRKQTNATAVTELSQTTEATEPPKRSLWKRINPLKRNPPPVPEVRGPSREYTAGFFSLLTFHWVTPLMSVGYSRPLEYNDLWEVNPNRAVDLLSGRLNENFAKRRRNGSKRPLLMAIYDTLKVEFLFGGLMQLISGLLQVISPFILRYLIQFASKAWYATHNGQPAPPIGHGIGLVFAVSIMQTLQTLCTNHFLYRGMLNGGQARAMLMAVIFDKAMVLSGRAKAGGKAIEGPQAPPKGVLPGSEAEKKWYKKMLKQKTKGKAVAVPSKQGVSGDGHGWSNGRIINLMSVDTYRIDQAFGMFHMLWTAPIQVLVTLVLLIINLSYSALAGFALLVVSMPLLAKAIRYLFKRRMSINKITDQRVSLTQEILQAVRFVKFFGWETAFLDRIFELRKREVRSIQWLLATRNAINAVSMSMPIFASMLSFITYSLSKHILNPAPIFSSLALFNALRMPLNFLPLVLGQVIDGIGSANRIQEFLLAEEAAQDIEFKYDMPTAIEIVGGDFTWERTPTQDTENEKSSRGPGSLKKETAKKSSKDGKTASSSDNFGGEGLDTASTLTENPPFQIRNVNLSIGRNELVAVIGSVGSGKSSLLAALAGDMRKTAGEVSLGAQRAFCPQYAWIQNATVRDNICFGLEFDQEWYDKVVDAAALRPDFEMLPDGDRTEIGERGITVSGGQKQRLNIARAIYFNADIILMDDPLSAVDAHVGRHIMDKAICGLLKDKCRILATHQLWVLNKCDRIVWMEDGHIEAVDTFQNLMAGNEGFQKLMSQTAVEEEQDKDKEVDEDEAEEEKKGDKKKKKKASALMTAEERAVESVSWSVYAAYIKAAGGYWVAPLVFCLLVLTQCANITTSLWLSWWTSDKFHFATGYYIAGYAGLGGVQVILMFLFSVSLSIFGTTASKVMLRDSMARVLRAPMSFFDTTPLGRITNRFSKDIDVMDNNLTDAMRMYFITLAMIIAVFVLIIVYFHYFAVALGPLFIMFLFSAGYYRASAREIKRHESVQRSFVFAKFSEAVSGVATIRAYGLQKHFSKGVREAIDKMNAAYYITFANQRWLSVRLDVIGNCLVFVVGILVVTSRFEVDPSIGGLVLSYILSIVQMIQFTVRQLAEVENNMNSTERVHYYATQLDQEAPLKLKDVRDTWPEKGEIIFDDVKMRYRPGLPLVLQGLTLHVQPGERIGIVGRTGAGKSSVMSTLFRMVELSGGSITIDGVNIAEVGLGDLRSRLAIIPQDPTLFRGTIRSNLDPFNEHTDLELWAALRQADLVGAETQMEDKSARINLDSVVEEEGLNFSLGQRQLMALARALVRGSQIIVCDEATSSVDMETDAKIQQTIATGFKGKTLLCIAHRLKTIINYDRIVVMDQGRIAELDTPIGLYEKNGIFRSMCERSGIRREDF